MRPTQPLHRVTVGRTREVRGPDALERGVVGVIIAVAMAMAVWFGIQLIHMTQTLDAISVASGPEYNEIIYRSVHGRWPSPDNPSMIAPGGQGYYVKHLTAGEGGVITAQMTLGPARGIMAPHGATVTETTHGFLSFRPELLGSQDAPTITFLCGYAKPVAGEAGISGTNKTTLDRKDLPPFCR